MTSFRNDKYSLVINWVGSLLIFLLSTTVSVHSQDLDKDMKFFYSGFITQPSLECYFNSKVYNADNSLFFDKQIRLVIHHDQYYYDMGDKLYISNNKYLLWLDKKDRRMIIGTTNAGEVHKFKRKLGDQLDTTSFKGRGEIIYNGIIGGLRSYTVKNINHPIIEEVNITFDISTNYIRKMEYIFKKEGNSGVVSSSTEFTKIDLKPRITDALFDQSQYFTVENNGFTLTKAYKDYDLTVVDQSILDRINQ